MRKSVKIMTGIVGFFMLIPGLVKFTDPFKTFFTKQIALGELPFPVLTYVIGQTMEIVTGILLFTVLLFWKKFHQKIAVKLYLLTNSVVIMILMMALYVHFHPAVPAEILPMEIKFPFLTLSLIFMSMANIYFTNKKYKTQLIN